MFKSLNSPPARLLQSSRLFSIPRPLPTPPLDSATSTGQYKASDTATLPYPVQQAITTPASSHFRGDFGLKRPLPSKATRTSTPHIKVNAHDNFAHITDFGSAANHTQTEAKWREMVVPMIVKQRKENYTGSTRKGPQSVYDDEVDNTDRAAVAIQLQQTGLEGESTAVKKRWKYEGPWITGMSEGEFQLYLMSVISERRGEFRDFMKKRLLQKRVQQEERVARREGRVVTYYRKEELRREIEQNYSEEEKRLRDDHTATHLSSELTAAICDFLDLPGIRAGDQSALPDVKSAKLHALLSDSLAHDENFSPPTTHPGAGLSHVRSHAYMENHPLYGPQAHRSPVLARVLRARNGETGNVHQATLGVGGVATNDPVSHSGGWRGGLTSDDPLENYENYNGMTEALNQELHGGNKIWTQPQSAYIDEKGNVRLDVGRGDKEAVAVKTGRTEPIHQARSASLQSPGVAMPRGANYGTALPDRRFGTSHVRGFDEELNTQQLKSTSDPRSAASRIMELYEKGGSSNRR